jgi:prephenate dehydrogenase
VRAGFGELPRTFVAGHPIAGTEKSGVGAAFGSLFHDRLVILTPADETSPMATEAIAQLWRTAGARVEFMTPTHHDHILAATSHLPHVLAFALVESLARCSASDEIFHYAAGGFRDFTRIASSDPVVWRDICVANRDAILTVLERFQTDLDTLREAIARGDAASLEARFGFAKQARDRFSERLQVQLDQ